MSSSNQIKHRPLLDAIVCVNGEGISQVPWHALEHPHPNRPPTVRTLAVDGRRSPENSKRLRQLCAYPGFARVPMQRKNATRAQLRNAGLAASSADYVVFLGSGFLEFADFFARLLLHVETLLDSGAVPLLVIPAIQLGRRETREFLATGRSAASYSALLRDLLLDNVPSDVRCWSRSSMFVVQRQALLRAGGYLTGRMAAGYDAQTADDDLVVRLLVSAGVLHPGELGLRRPEPGAPHEERPGWDLLRRSFADVLAHQGLYAVEEARTEPRELVSQEAGGPTGFPPRAARYLRDGFVPRPLPAPGRDRQLLCSPDPRVLNPEACQFFDNPAVVNPKDIDLSALLDYLQEHRVEIVVFTHPAVLSPPQLALYERVKALQYPFLVVGFGALPGAVYFDPTGTPAESTLYDPVHWDRPLGPAAHQAVEEYRNLLNAQRPAADANQRFRTDGGEHTLLILLQAEGDADAEAFPGELASAKRYTREMELLCSALPASWRACYAHVSEGLRCTALPQCQEIGSSELDRALAEVDLVVTLNSELGLHALLHGTPVFHFGDVFYGSRGLARRARTYRDILRGLEHLSTPDPVKLQRFLHYLATEFYSFAESIRKTADPNPLARGQTIKSLRYSVLRVHGRGEWRSETGSAQEPQFRSSSLFREFVRQAAQGRSAPGPIHTSTRRAREIVHWLGERLSPRP